jgi:undecaprenyl-diphosphatase
MRTLQAVVLLAASLVSSTVLAGGPFGIDHTLNYDNSGIWARNNQLLLMNGTILAVLGGGLLLGDNDKLGDTFWRSVDSMVITAVGDQAMKSTFQRKRPSQSTNPNDFFSGSGAQSFPSGEVATITAAVTPFIINYGGDHPAVYALALLPAYDAVARVKVHGHWQSDVIVGAALGAGIGWWMADRDTPFIINWLPGGFRIGFVHRI